MRKSKNEIEARFDWKKHIEEISNKESFDNFMKSCIQYGADVRFDRCIDIVFKDGKVLRYAMPLFPRDQSIDICKFLTISHGRVFSSHNAFIGYAPKSNTIDELLISVDIMI